MPGKKQVGRWQNFYCLAQMTCKFTKTKGTTLLLMKTQEQILLLICIKVDSLPAQSIKFYKPEMSFTQDLILSPHLLVETHLRFQILFQNNGKIHMPTVFSCSAICHSICEVAQGIRSRLKTVREP